MLVGILRHSHGALQYATVGSPTGARRLTDRVDPRSFLPAGKRNRPAGLMTWKNPLPSMAQRPIPPVCWKPPAPCCEVRSAQLDTRDPKADGESRSASSFPTPY
jgi:hypothetical protein